MQSVAAAAAPPPLSLLELCALREEPTSSWKDSSAEELAQSISNLLSDGHAFELQCDATFREHQNRKTEYITFTQLAQMTTRITERLGCQNPETLTQIYNLRTKVKAACAQKTKLAIDEFKGYIVGVLARVQSRHETQSAGLQTCQPVRIRMRSTDKLCARSLEVEWENGTGQRQSWSSWDDQVQNGWYEAEKILPSSVTDIKVSFKVRGVIESWPLRKVNRKQHCAWVRKKGADQRMLETVSLRCTESTLTEPVDAVFQLSGLGPVCHVARAWNAARVRSPADWEFWEVRSWRPRMEPRLATLVAADEAAPPNAGLGDHMANVNSCQRRLSAAAGKLIEIRRNTINGLRRLDSDLTTQWYGVNSANTFAAGLAMSSAAAMFVCPPIGVGFGMAAAATGGATTVIDLSQDHYSLREFQQQMATDVWNTIAVAELENDWLLACNDPGQAFETSSQDTAGSAHVTKDMSIGGGRLLQMSSAMTSLVSEVVEGSLATSGAAAQAGAAASTGYASSSASSAMTASSAVKVGSMASRAFVVFGAVAATGIAVHGWSTTKFSQQAVRSKLAELTSSLLYMQRWLAGMDTLECPICLENMGLTDEAQCCSNNWHYFHAQCLEQWCEECVGNNLLPTCPECRGSLTDEVKALDEFITGDVRTQLSVERASALRDRAATL